MSYWYNPNAFTPKQFLFILLFSAALLCIPFLLNNGKLQIQRPPIVFKKSKPDDLEKFLDKLGNSESNNRYDIKNQFGFMGRYQIGRQALKEIGMDGVPDSIFLRTPDLQEVAVVKLLKRNKEYILPYIKKYKGDTICDVIITESGLIAAAYGTGAGSVMKFLDSNGGEDPVDGNGIQTSFLIKKYNGYNLSSL